MKNPNKENKGLNSSLNKSFKSVAELLDTRSFKSGITSVKATPSKDTDTPSKSSRVTIKDLCPEEKQKIGDLIQKLAQEKKEKTELVEKFKQEKQELRNSISALSKNHQVLLTHNLGTAHGE